MLIPLESDERAQFLDNLARRAAPTFDFFLFSVLCGATLGVGLLLDSPALLVLGALLAPLMTPAVGISLGTVIGSPRYFGRSLAGFLIGSLFVFLVGALSGIVAKIWMPLDLTQAHLHAQLTWAGFFVLAFGAVLTAASLVRSEKNPVLPSVALAYELFVPLAVAGFGLGSGEPNLWPDGLELFAVHLAWATLLAALTLAILGFRPYTLFGYTLSMAVALVGVILIIGAMGTGAVLDAVAEQPTPTITFTATVPTSIPTASITPIPPTATTTPTDTLTSTITPTVTLTPTPTLIQAIVSAATDAGGGILRSGPGFDSPAITAVNNGTLVYVLSAEPVEIEGFFWVEVYIPELDLQGWMLQTLLVTATPAPNWDTPTASPPPP